MESAADLSPRAKLGAFLLLLAWAFVVIFPIYWLFVTSFKTPYDVDKGAFYIPFVDFQPTLDAWKYILLDLGNDTIRPYRNTVIVGLTSSVLALVLGSLAAYALVRFTYRPRIGIIGLFIGSIAFAFVAMAIGAPPVIAFASAVAVFASLAQTIGRRFVRSPGNSDSALWVIAEPPARALPNAVPTALTSASTITFCGFRSRWTMPWRWAKRAASRTWRISATAWPLSRPASIRPFSVGPSMYCMAM